VTCDPAGRSLVGPRQLCARLLLSDAGGIEPLRSSRGVEMVSMDMFLGDENTPLGWQGPVISSALKQFYKDTGWGQLDYLLIDLSPFSGGLPVDKLQPYFFISYLFLTKAQRASTPEPATVEKDYS